MSSLPCKVTYPQVLGIRSIINFGLSSLTQYIQARTPIFLRLWLLLTPSAMAVLPFLLDLVQAIVFTKLPRAIIILCQHSLLASSPGCQILHHWNELSNLYTLLDPTFCFLSLDPAPSRPSTIVLFWILPACVG